MPIWICLKEEKKEDPMDDRIKSIVARKARPKGICREFGCDRDCHGEHCAEHKARHKGGKRG